MTDLITLKGIHRKTANLILLAANIAPEGILVDLHVLRVVNRMGITSGSKNATTVEKELMILIKKKYWQDIGLALSYHGREICRPKPKCTHCLIKKHCRYYNSPPTEKNTQKKTLVKD